jgi:protein involved in polysaccharide export with SLBB domain
MPQDPAKDLSKWMWLNNEWVEVRGTTTEAVREPTTEKATVPEAPPSSEWAEVADASDETRVIAIPVKPLQSGEARYNIVVRPGDVISIPSPEAGKRYYVMGHVRGPGAFTIPMEGITLKAAIAAAGGLDPYAWPSRCEIVRKIGADQEELHQIDLDRIFAMKDDDIRLKPGDVVNVGTHPLSPFLVTIANGFRTTYGFGFVYDRNFGTIDSYGIQQNPRDRRRAEQNARFPALQAAFPGL